MLQDLDEDDLLLSETDEFAILLTLFAEPSIIIGLLKKFEGVN